MSYLCDGHGSGDWAYTPADGGQEADLHAVNYLVEFFNLLLLGCLVVPLFGDGGVSLRVDFFGFERLRHLGSCNSGEVSVAIWLSKDWCERCSG